MALYYMMGQWTWTISGLWEEGIIRWSLGAYVLGIHEKHNITKDMIYPMEWADLAPVKFPWVCAFLDIGALVVFFVCILGFSRRISRIADEADLNSISAEDYSIAVEGLPADLHDAKKVAEYFRHWGEVHSVLLCYNIMAYVPMQAALTDAYNRYMKTIIDMSHHQRKPIQRPEQDENRQVLKVNCEYTDKDLGTKCKRMFRAFGLSKDLVYWKKKLAGLLLSRQKLSARKGNPATRPTAQMAFVTFMKSASATACRADFKTATSHTCGFVTRQNGVKAFEHNLKRYLLDVHAPPEPKDVRWENLAKRGWNAFWRTRAADVIALILCLVGAGAFVGMMIAKRVASESRLGDSIGSMALGIVYSVIVKCVGFFIKFLLRKLAAFECAHTHSGAVNDLVEKLWMTDFLNSVGAMFIFSAIFQQDESVAGSAFLRRPWYADTATALAWVIFMDCILNFALDLLRPVPLALFLLARIRADSQVELNDAYEPDEWDLTSLMGSLTKLIFVSLFCCMLVPIVIPVFAFYLIVYYPVVKYNLLRRSKLPAQYSKDIATKVTGVLPWALHLHCIIAILVYFGTVGFNTDLIQENWDKSSDPFGHGLEYYGAVGSLSGWIMTGFYFLLLLFFMIKFCYHNRKHLGCRKNTGGKKVSLDDETGGRPFTEFQSRIFNYIDTHPFCSDAQDEHSPKQDTYDCGQLRCHQYYSFWSAVPYVRDRLRQKVPGIESGKAGMRIDMKQLSAQMANPLVAGAGWLGVTCNPKSS